MFSERTRFKEQQSDVSEAASPSHFESVKKRPQAINQFFEDEPEVSPTEAPVPSIEKEAEPAKRCRRGLNQFFEEEADVDESIIMTDLPVRTKPSMSKSRKHSSTRIMTMKRLAAQQ
jgi:hypothetical protein